MCVVDSVVMYTDCAVCVVDYVVMLYTDCAVCVVDSVVMLCTDCAVCCRFYGDVVY